MFKSKTNYAKIFFVCAAIFNLKEKNLNINFCKQTFFGTDHKLWLNFFNIILMIKGDFNGFLIMKTIKVKKIFNNHKQKIIKNLFYN